ncbi:MAG: hypothetical protein R3F43_05920 [bacterium]
MLRGRALPVGSTGRVLLLLSGGIDSPVAGYPAQKRTAVEAVYSPPPYVSEASRAKVIALARRLALATGRPHTLHIVPFTAVQEAIRDAAGAGSVLLYRRFMYRIAAALAKPPPAAGPLHGREPGPGRQPDPRTCAWSIRCPMP